jgi:hypothetical protein
MYIVTGTKKDKLWSMSGYQGNRWERAQIPVTSNESFKVSHNERATKHPMLIRTDM